MAIELTEKFLPYVDEIFTTGSRTAALTNRDFTFEGAHSVRIRTVSTSPMNDYGRTGPTSGNWSRYGAIADLNSSTKTFVLRKDRSFTFTIDAVDKDETQQIVAAASALARQLREVVVPEVDTWTLAQMVAGAGLIGEVVFTAQSVYSAILEASEEMDIAQVPEANRLLIVPPKTYTLLKQIPDIAMHTTMASDVVKSGVVSMLDGMQVVRVPADRLPADCAFMIAHPCATVGVQKLADYKTHINPPGINGALVEGRIVYDSFVLPNKAKAICYTKYVDTPSASVDGAIHAVEPAVDPDGE